MNETYQHAFGEWFYVMKKHWASRLHYDLRLMWNGVLLSWAIPVRPVHRVGGPRIAIEMEDHNAANILFEGVHRTGPIMVWDRGTWEPHVASGDVLASLAKGILQFTLRGEKLSGLVTLNRKDNRTGNRPLWSLHREASPSTHSCADRGTPSNWCKSVCTGRSREQIVRDWNSSKLVQPDLFGRTYSGSPEAVVADTCEMRGSFASLRMTPSKVATTAIGEAV